MTTDGEHAGRSERSDGGGKDRTDLAVERGEGVESGEGGESGDGRDGSGTCDGSCTRDGSDTRDDSGARDGSCARDGSLREEGPASQPGAVAAHLREVLAAVPVLLGHHPCPGSIVVAGLVDPTDPDPRLVARIDTEVLTGRSATAVAESVAAHLRGMGCSWAVVARYVARVPTGTGPAEPVAAVAPVRAACLAAGVHWAGEWALDDSWVRQDPDGPRFPRAELAHTTIAAWARAAGREPVARREEVGRIPAADHPDRRVAAEARLRWTHHRAEAAPDAAARPWGDWQRRSLRRWQEALAHPGLVPRATLGRIESGLEDPLVVEACVLTLVIGPFEEERDAEWVHLLSAPPVPVPVSAGPTDAGPRSGLRPWLAAQLVPGAIAPEAARVDAAVRLLCRVVSHGRRTRQSGAFALLGLLAWWTGDGVRGSVLVERALAGAAADPLAAQLDWLLSAGAVPGWAHRSEAAG